MNFFRYEDSLSLPGQPFSFGISMTGLSVVSTDKNYSPCLDTDRLVYKVGLLHQLIYDNIYLLKIEMRVTKLLAAHINFNFLQHILLPSISYTCVKITIIYIY